MKEGYKESPLGILPRSWDVKKINEVTTYVDYRGKTPPKVNEGILLVTARNIKKGKIDYKVSEEYIPVDLYESVMSRGLPKIGDVLITTEAPLGNVATIDNENIALAQRVIKYRGNNGVLDNVYLKHYFLSDIFQNLLEKESTGSTVKGIKGSRLHKLKLIVPPLPEQQKIAEILSTVDAKIEIIDQQISETSELKKGLMQRLLTKGIGHTKFKDSVLGEIPESWEVVSANEIGEITSSKRVHKADYTDVGIPFFRGKEITQLSKREELNDIVYIKKSTFEDFKRKYGAPEKGDILITAVGTIGSIYLVKENDEFYFKDGNLMWIRNITKKLERNFLMHYFRSIIFQHLIDIASGGSSQKALTIVKFRKLSIPIPPEVEQKKISEILSSIDDKLQVLSEKKVTYQELKQGLMQQLLTGKVRVKV